MTTKSQLILEAYAKANGYHVNVWRDQTDFLENCPYCGRMGFADWTGKTLDAVVINVGCFGETPEQVWDDMLCQLMQTINKTEDELMISLDIN